MRQSIHQKKNKKQKSKGNKQCYRKYSIQWKYTNDQSEKRWEEKESEDFRSRTNFDNFFFFESKHIKKGNHHFPRNIFQTNHQIQTNLTYTASIQLNSIEFNIFPLFTCIIVIILS